MNKHIFYRVMCLKKIRIMIKKALKRIEITLIVISSIYFLVSAEKRMMSVNAVDIDALRSLDCAQEVYLSGTIYTARDAAHKKLVEIIEKNEKLPFELKNSIIFYAGPCPKKDGEIIGPIGPTTSKRMDKFAPLLYEKGVLATIGKGIRSNEVAQSIKDNNALYFSVQGGVASLLQSCVKSAEVVAFEDLGAEAIYKIEVEKLPIRLDLK